MNEGDLPIIKRIDFDPEFEPLFQVSPLIEHELLTGAEKAKEMLIRARKEAVRLRKRAHALINQASLKKEAERKEGFQEGREEGLASVTEQVFKAGQAHEKLLKEAESEIIRMVMEIAEKVIGREIARGAVVDIVRQAIEQTTGERIVLRMNPNDLPELRKREKDLLSIVDRTKSISIKEDETVSVGGCIVESELAKVDARLETQLAAIRKALGL